MHAPNASKYETVKELGRGGEGSVFLVKRTSDQQTFVLKKRLCAGFEDANAALKEALGLAKYQSMHIVRYEDVYLERVEVKGEDHAMNLCIVMEHCAGGDLKRWLLKARPEDRTAEFSAWASEKGQADLKRWMWEMAKGLQVIHESGAIHRDIKTENILLTHDGTIKIGDFGLVHRIQRGSEVKGVEGTYLYMAPEVIAKKPYNTKADIFSLGLVYLELITGEMLSERASISGVQGGWKSGEIKLQKSSSSNDSSNNNSSNSQSARNPPIRGQPVGDEALNDPIYDPEMRCKAIKIEPLRKIVASMLALEPEKRPTATELVVNSFLLGSFASNQNAVEQAKAPGASLSTLGSSTRELLKASHKDAAAKAVADALSECPRLRFLFTASEKKRPTAEQLMFSGQMMVDFGQSKGQLLGRVHPSDEVQGVAVWGRPSTDMKSDLNLFSIFGKMMKAGRPFKDIGIGLRFKLWRKWLNSRIKKLAPPQHIYIITIAVASQHQRKGVGTSLMNEVVKRAQEDGLPILAHTFTPESTRWCKQFDFAVVAEEPFPEFQSLKVWTLLRQPKPKP